MVLIPSVKATIPFLLRRPNSVICFPSVFLVKLADGNILILDLSLPLLFKKSTIETLSITGDVFGIETTDVTPPDKAALLKVLKFSLYSYPGSPTKTLISTMPGIRICFFKSILSTELGKFPLATFFPTALIKPFESIINPPTSFI